MMPGGKQDILALRRGLRYMVRAGVNYHQAMKELKRLYVLTAIEQAGGNRLRAARNIGIHRNRIYDHVGPKKSALLNRRPPGSQGAAAAPAISQIGGAA